MPMKADDFLINFSRKTVEAGNVTETDANESVAAKFGDKGMRRFPRSGPPREQQSGAETRAPAPDRFVPPRTA
jgi:hypothetical protein